MAIRRSSLKRQRIVELNEDNTLGALSIIEVAVIQPPFSRASIDGRDVIYWPSSVSYRGHWRLDEDGKPERYAPDPEPQPE